MSDVSEYNLANTLQALSQALSALGSDAQSQLGIRYDPRLEELIHSLPRLTEADLGPQCDGVCPICLVQFRAHLAEEETALAMDSPAHAEQDLGVTRLENTCKHIFCRKDISVWIRQSRNSCPTCRRPLLDPPTEDSTSRQQDNPNTESRENGDGNQDAVSQIAEDVIHEVLEALGPADNPTNPDQADVVRRLVETLLPGSGAPQTSSTTDHPERPDSGMYS